MLRFRVANYLHVRLVKSWLGLTCLPEENNMFPGRNIYIHTYFLYMYIHNKYIQYAGKNQEQHEDKGSFLGVPYIYTHTHMYPYTSDIMR